MFHQKITTLLVLPVVLGMVAVMVNSLNAKEPLRMKEPPVWQGKELRRFNAAEANQGVAVDDEFFYAITNRAIGKYRKSDGQKVLDWKDSKGGPFIHLNAGLVDNGKLIGAHSNFPGIPMTSSIEYWDAATLQHTDSFSFGILPGGSLTWLARKDKKWFACFVHYNTSQKATGKDSAWSRIVELDGKTKQPVKSWVFPPALLARFNGSSASGGSFGPGGYLYVSGHDGAEIYVLTFPESGSVMNWIATVSAPINGQAFAWDSSRSSILYGINRKTREVIEIQVDIPAAVQK